MGASVSTEQTIETLKSEKAKVEHENKWRSKRIDELSKEIDSYQLCLKRLQLENKQLTAKSSEMVKTLSLYKNQTAEKCLQLNSYQSYYQTQEQVNKRLQQENQQLNEKSSEMVKTLSLYKNQTAEKCLQLNSYQSYYQTQEQVNKRLQQENQQLNEKSSEMVKTLSLYKNQTAEKCLQLNSYQSYYQTQEQVNKRLQQENQQLNEKSSEAVKTLSECRRQIANKNVQLDVLGNCIQRLKNENKEQAENVSEMMKIISEYKKQNEETSLQLALERVKTIPECKKQKAMTSLWLGEAEAAIQMVTLTRETQTDEDDLLNSDDDLAVLRKSRVKTVFIPYSPNVKEMWFKKLIIRPPEAEPRGCTNRLRIFMYNTQLELANHHGQVTIPEKLSTLLKLGQKVYYHATDAGSLQNILENGIDLTKTNRPVDFSHGRGFYVTDNFQRAVKWSDRVGSSVNSTGAIIAFKIDKKLRKEEPYLSLKSDNDTNRKWWECIVSHFRHGKTSPDVKNVLRGVKFIKGPVAKTNKLYAKQIPVAFDDFIQICICNDDYAKRFGSLQNIAFVIIFS